MGISYSVYCGPAVVCVPEKVLGIERLDGICLECRPPSGHILSVLDNVAGKDRFCSTCGRTLKSITRETAKKQDYWEITSLMNEALSCWEGEDQKYHVYIPNSKRNPPREFHVQDLTPMAILSPETITNELKWLSESFSKEITLLEQRYHSLRIQFIVAGRWT